MEKQNTIDQLKKMGILNFDIVDSIADWVRVVDIKNNIIYANKSMIQELDEDIIGKKCFESYCNNKPCHICITDRSIKTGQVIQKEEEIDGKYYSVKSSPVRNDDGDIIAAVEVFRDVTRERKLEKELIEKNKGIRLDLFFSKKIQSKMLPKRGIYDNMKLDYIYQPSNVLSGDMFDIIRLDDKHWGIYICDVSGHGIAASLMTMFVRQSMLSIAPEKLSPIEVIKDLHSKFKDLGLDYDKYFTMFYVVINTETMKMKYINAGHNATPLLFNNEAWSIIMLENNGYPIMRIFDEVNYEEKEISLFKNDAILFYTDGITEAKNRDGEQFGIDRIKQIIIDSDHDLLLALETELDKFTWGEKNDDLAAMLIEIM
ncbi:MAG: SpoIIE family protein phosphatase [Tissierellia bacterium]|nr:SpoIIE family protein phosphatase [Tissierellia bacterium]